MRKLVIFLIGLLWVTPLQAQNTCGGTQPVTALIPLAGPDTFLLRAPPLRPHVLTLDTSALVPAPTLSGPICVVQVSLDGTDRPALRDSVKLSLEPGAGLPRIKVDVTDADFRSPGSWKVTGVAGSLRFTFTLLRKAAVLSVPANLKLRIDGSEISPSTFAVRESGGETSISSLAITVDQVTNVDHKSTATLSFANVSVAPNQPAILTPTVIGDFPLGTTKTKITFSAPELSAPFTADIEVFRRGSIVYLLLALGLGLVSSMYFRHRLAARIVLDEARLAAAGEVARVVGIAELESDPVVRQALASIARALEATYTLERTKAAIDAAVVQRKAEADRIIDEAARRRVKLRQDWDALRKTYDPAVAFDPAITALTAAIRARLGEIGRDVVQGALFNPERQLLEITETLVPQLQAALGGVCDSLKPALDEVSRWQVPGELSDEARRLKTDIDPALPLVTADAIAQVNKLALRARDWLRQRVNRQRADEMLELEPRLREAHFVQLANAWANEAKLLFASPSNPSAFGDLASAVHQTVQHRVSLIASLRTSPDPKVRTEIAKNNLLTALSAQAASSVVPPPAMARLAIPASVEAAPAVFAPPSAFVPAITLPVSADYIIVSPQVIAARTDISVQLLPARALAADDTVRWTGATVGDERETATLRADEAGFLDVSCTVSNAKGRVLGIARAVLLVAAGGGATEKAIHWLYRIDWQVAIGLAFSALLALGTGYLMLESAWLGRPDQWVMAFLWASVVDLGLAKAGDIVRPVTQKVTMPATRT